MTKEAESNVQSVERAILILEKLSEEKKGCGVTKISKDIGLSKSTVHRLLLTLMNKGYVEKEIDSDNYRLGKRILYLASSILDSLDIGNISRPYLKKLAQETDQVVHLAVLDGDKAVYIDKVESDSNKRSVRMNSQIGKRIPLYCTAVGKVLLWDYDENYIRAVIKEQDMVKYTQNTITNIDGLINELKESKEKGYAVDEIEFEEGIRCIAAPIYNREGKVEAAASVSGLTIHMTDDKMKEIKKILIEITEEISYQLGYIKNK